MAAEARPAPLPAAFYARPSLEVARDLLGCLLTDGEVTLRLVEVEAYAGTTDPASHSFRGPTPRNSIMWGPPGKLYVYFTYGMHWCMNAVCGAEGDASAVLLRAGEVVDGLESAEARRPGVRERDLARGPARMARLLDITGADNHTDLTAGGPPVTLLAGKRIPDRSVRTGPRVGLNPRMGEAAHWPWRYWVDGSKAVSPFRPGGLRARKPPLV
ncbi:MAG TPA: DNA-3-methyladenine glycosylase [Frankiaceae bacterium]|nr:DNA-3-methyladenine glycosylase [Frankiaceae bacterium]